VRPSYGVRTRPRWRHRSRAGPRKHLSAAWPSEPTTTPATAPAAAAVSPITRSAAPCTSVRASSGADSESNVDAATVHSDHPSPSRNSPTPIWYDAPAGAVPESSSARSSTTAPAASTVGRPRRSVSHPTTGARAGGDLGAGAYDLDDPRPRRAPAGRLAAVEGRLKGHQQGVGVEEHRDDGSRAQGADQSEQEQPGEHRHTEGPPGPAGRTRSGSGPRRTRAGSPSRGRPVDRCAPSSGRAATSRSPHPAPARSAGVRRAPRFRTPARPAARRRRSRC
jgi:hypothetical protein